MASHCLRCFSGELLESDPHPGCSRHRCRKHFRCARRSLSAASRWTSESWLGSATRRHGTAHLGGAHKSHRCGDNWNNNAVPRPCEGMVWCGHCIGGVVDRRCDGDPDRSPPGPCRARSPDTVTPLEHGGTLHSFRRDSRNRSIDFRPSPGLHGAR